MNNYKAQQRKPLNTKSGGKQQIEKTKQKNNTTKERNSQQKQSNKRCLKEFDEH